VKREKPRKTLSEYIEGEAWSFDQKKFQKDLDEGGEVLMIIRAHLYIEHIVIGLLRAALAFPERIDLDRMAFARKVELCEALGVMPKDLAGAVRKLNAFRNKAAHHLNFEPTTEQKSEFAYAFTGRYADERLRGTNFGTQLATLIYGLEFRRQAYVKEKREEQALLDEALAAAKKAGYT
jgi:hypothetical protein